MKTQIILAGCLFAIATASATAQEFYDDFGGFYAGVIGGIAGGKVDGYYSGTPGPSIPPVSYDFTLHPSGLTIGGVVGYAYPWQTFVFSVEGDLSIVLGANAEYTYATSPLRRDTVSIGALGHIRGIAGYPVGTFTPFVAAGIAVAGVSASHTGPLDPSGTQTWTQNALLVGPSLGVGTDIALGNGMNVRLEVLADFFASRRFDWIGDGMRYSDVALHIVTARAGVTVPF